MKIDTFSPTRSLVLLVTIVSYLSPYPASTYAYNPDLHCLYLRVYLFPSSIWRT